MSTSSSRRMPRGRLRPRVGRRRRAKGGAGSSRFARPWPSVAADRETSSRVRVVRPSWSRVRSRRGPVNGSSVRAALLAASDLGVPSSRTQRHPIQRQWLHLALERVALDTATRPGYAQRAQPVGTLCRKRCSRRCRAFRQHGPCATQQHSEASPRLSRPATRTALASVDGPDGSSTSTSGLLAFSRRRREEARPRIRRSKRPLGGTCVACSGQAEPRHLRGNP